MCLENCLKIRISHIASRELCQHHWARLWCSLRLLLSKNQLCPSGPRRQVPSKKTRKSRLPPRCRHQILILYTYSPRYLISITSFKSHMMRFILVGGAARLHRINENLVRRAVKQGASPPDICSPPESLFAKVGLGGQPRAVGSEPVKRKACLQVGSGS
jgi:hypothetical protein